MRHDIGNRDDADLGVLGEWAGTKGMAIATALDREDGGLPSLHGTSLLISMGSVWLVHDPELEPLIRPEQALLREAVAAGVPVVADSASTTSPIAWRWSSAQTRDRLPALIPTNGAAIHAVPGCSTTTTPADCPLAPSSCAPATTTVSRPTAGLGPPDQVHPEVDARSSRWSVNRTSSVRCPAGRVGEPEAPAADRVASSSCSRSSGPAVEPRRPSGGVVQRGHPAGRRLGAGSSCEPSQARTTMIPMTPQRPRPLASR